MKCSFVIAFFLLSCAGQEFKSNQAIPQGSNQNLSQAPLQTSSSLAQGTGTIGPVPLVNNEPTGPELPVQIAGFNLTLLCDKVNQDDLQVFYECYYHEKSTDSLYKEKIEVSEIMVTYNDKKEKVSFEQSWNIDTGMRLKFSLLKDFAQKGAKIRTNIPNMSSFMIDKPQAYFNKNFASSQGQSSSTMLDMIDYQKCEYISYSSGKAMCYPNKYLVAFSSARFFPESGIVCCPSYGNIVIEDSIRDVSGTEDARHCRENEFPRGIFKHIFTSTASVSGFSCSPKAESSSLKLETDYREAKIRLSSTFANAINNFSAKNEDNWMKEDFYEKILRLFRDSSIVAVCPKDTLMVGTNLESAVSLTGQCRKVISN